ncbi:hypothetical protein [Riemerella columbina]|uniref:hypothetical protein n=1 Tax=Riemerella columbina TaxID=103810 RepID=UPI00266EBF94|nr:hypothetical protein [Riemerella columbina]WKS94439.1 hypothetical protein NYR17_05705 [Riemerella columbina]
MKLRFYSWIILGMMLHCQHQPEVHLPMNTPTENQDIIRSQKRSKHQNEIERQQIEAWIKQQNQPFYPMGLNYWIDVPQLSERAQKPLNTPVSYEYEIYDFEEGKIYSKPKVVTQQILGKYQELKAVEDAVRYLKPQEKATLLIPSVLAFGTYGDGDKISGDMPMIIKLKMN